MSVDPVTEIRSADDARIGDLAEVIERRAELWPVRGYATFHCLHALEEVGFLADLEDRGRLRLAAWATEHGVDSTALDAVVRYLYGLGVLDRDGTGAYFAAVDVPREERALVQLLFAYDSLFHDLTRILRRQVSYGEHVRRRPDLDARATAALFSRTVYPRVLARLHALGARNVLDLGCGTAELLARWCAGGAGRRGYGVDLSEEAVEYARHRLAERALDGRVRLVVGDLAQPEIWWSELGPAGEEGHGIDALVSTAVLHELTEESTAPLVSILQRLRRAFPRAPLVLFEGLEQADDTLRRDASPALEHHLFHRLSRQGIARREEWDRAFVTGGYAIGHREPLVGGEISVLLPADATGAGRQYAFDGAPCSVRHPLKRKEDSK